MGYERGWLAYSKRTDPETAAWFRSVCAQADGRVVNTALRELHRAAKELLGAELRQETDPGKASICLTLNPDDVVGAEGYHMKESMGRIEIASAGQNGLLYACFALIRRVQRNLPLQGLREEKTPANPLRMLNHWDNIDGSIERGYSGNSFFFKEGKVLVNERTREYARLAASVGINASVINNVNVKGNATKLITETYGREIRRMADIFADYGIRLFLSVNFAAPIELGGLDSADPLDERVAGWWKDAAAALFAKTPNLGGFLVKADSEGRPGPFTYKRTHADGANMLADAVKPFGGTIVWRCFVYNCQQDWRDRKTDRARSGYDNFMPLDGSFRDNVVLQIKNGPMDFQVREPVSPLFGGLTHTNEMLEVQIAQEYTGQQRHVCYLIPMFKEILAYRTYCTPEKDTVADLVSGRTYGTTCCGMAAVANTGSDENWTGHDLAAANLYGFGRLSYDTALGAEELAREWAGCTFGTDERVVDTIVKILMMSWPSYEKYTAPLGIGWMVNPNYHYGPNVDGYEYDRWGTYHRADHLGIGVDRTIAGTGYAGQYHEPMASLYNDPDTCPEELLLFFHHIPYTHKLRNGSTVIQHIYDTHFEGAEAAAEMARLWDTLEGQIDNTAFLRVQQRFAHQKEHAKEWRDQINTYFYRKSMIPDERGRTIY